MNVTRVSKDVGFERLCVVLFIKAFLYLRDAMRCDAMLMIGEVGRRDTLRASAKGRRLEPHPEAASLP